MIIYIVQGQTGEYSDRSEWVVKAFTSKAVAEDFVVRCSEIARINFSHRDDEDYYDDGFKFKKSDLDPFFSMDYTGTNYYISECELEETK